MDFPLMTTKRHNEILHIEMKRHDAEVLRLERMHARERRELKKGLKDVVDKMSTDAQRAHIMVHIGSSADAPIFRCYVDFDESLVRHGFCRGDDNKMLGYVADILRDKIYYELKTYNFKGHVFGKSSSGGDDD